MHGVPLSNGITLQTQSSPLLLTGLQAIRARNQYETTRSVTYPPFMLFCTSTTGSSQYPFHISPSIRTPDLSYVPTSPLSLPSSPLPLPSLSLPPPSLCLIDTNLSIRREYELIGQVLSLDGFNQVGHSIASVKINNVCPLSSSFLFLLFYFILFYFILFVTCLIC